MRIGVKLEYEKLIAVMKIMRANGMKCSSAGESIAILC